MCSDPKDMIVPEIAEYANEWKNTKKGVDGMCKAVEDYAKEKAEKAEMQKAVDIALTLLRRGRDTISEISLITKLSIGFITQLAIDNNITYTV